MRGHRCVFALKEIARTVQTVLLAAVACVVFASAGVSADTDPAPQAAGERLDRNTDDPGRANRDSGIFSAADREIIGRYLEGLAKPDGGYGWAEQYDSHLSVTFAVVGAYRALGMSAPQASRIAAYVRRGHPITGPLSETRKHWTELREFDAQQIQTLLWLGEDASEFCKRVESWRTISSYTTGYERGGNPVLRQEVQPVLCRALLGLAIDPLLPAFSDYLAARMRADGSFNNTPASDGSGGHLVNTCLAVRARRAMGIEPSEAAFDWIARCQGSSGGFQWSPSPEIGAVEDVSYTWAAVGVLALGGRRPTRSDACIAWLRSLWNDDGGFADRPGVSSSALATYQALDALRTLGAPLPAARCPHSEPPRIASDLRAFTIQLEAPGNGSIAEAVELARILRIDLWGAKNAKSEWIAAANALAREQAVPVTFFASNEAYGDYVEVPGLGRYSHLNDSLAPPGRPLADWARKVGPWQAFADEYVQPLRAQGGRMVWQICDNEELARVLLDESVAHGGYDMLSTFHFWCHNMAQTLPFVMRYREEIPLVALQDAHDEAWWWADNLAGYRTVFLAADATWDGWLEALREKRVVAVRRDAQTRGKLRMLGGTPQVRQAVFDRGSQWQWWDDRGSVLDQTPASIVVVRSDDVFEPGRPDRGTVLRIRVRQTHVPGRGLLPEPLAELVAVHLDGAPLDAALVESRNARGDLQDRYFLAPISALAAGEHKVVVQLKKTATGELLSLKKTIRLSAVRG